MARGGGGSADAGPGSRGVALGFLAMLPLFASYEVGVAIAGQDSPRNLAELLLGQALVFLSAYETPVRIAFLVVCALFAFVQVRLTGLELGRSLVFVCLEGIGFALALGPLLVLTMSLFGVTVEELGLAGRAPGAGVSLERAARSFGAGAWEELVFRVGAYSAVFLLAKTLAKFLGAGDAVARGVSETLAMLLSALLFAACHLDAAMRLVGLEGESWEPRVFLWRTLAGLFLAGLFRWRGPGVTAWAHGLFNLALILGSGPGVFR
ncbi:MAG: CPBP family glutamic-type intramembrane protease [Planctomycetota bacterium]